MLLRIEDMRSSCAAYLVVAIFSFTLCKEIHVFRSNRVQ